MTEGKHTPGPWSVCAANDGNCSCKSVLYADGVICEVRDFNDDMADATGHAPSPEQAMANKRLIAAAPDLLGVLVEALAIYNARDRIATLDRAGYRRDEERESLERRCDEWLAKRRAAIAKATGAS